ncbi:MAG TPA: PfkB family carbohydrate kinase [Streptosporangiaceae bacterium]|nr:PfkB family carbohydrate kinase [Streptosporangiaceae bacterium]
MTARFSRLVHLGNVVVDVVLDVPALPQRGGDVLASAAQLAPGGGFNVMAAAARQGLPTRYAGAIGTGPFADLASAALAAEGIEALQPPKTGMDTGFVVTMVDDDGERTFVTSRGAEATLTPEDLAGITAGPGDAVYLSGYGLVHPDNRASLLGWLDRLDRLDWPDHLGRAGRGGALGTPGAPGGTGAQGGTGALGVTGARHVVFFDPGPLVRDVPAKVLASVLRRADWLTCNAAEATLLTGALSPGAAWRTLTAGRPGGGVVLRMGPDGCLVSRVTEPGAGATGPVHVAGFQVPVVDTNGAGDTHAGTFIAALAGGADPVTAARTANAAAAVSVTRHGPATAPSAGELAEFLATR